MRWKPRPIREQAVIPHAVEAAREHMQEDAPDELRRGQGHGLLTRCVGTAVVGVAEPDLPRVEGEEPLVGDGDPMRVPTDVIEHLVGPGEGWLGVDHPVGLPGGLEMGGKVLPIVEGVECAGEVQLAGLERLAHGVEQQPANEPGEHPDREEEPGAARHPLRTIGESPPPLAIGCYLVVFRREVGRSGRSVSATTCDWVLPGGGAKLGASAINCCYHALISF